MTSEEQFKVLKAAWDQAFDLEPREVDMRIGYAAPDHCWRTARLYTALALEKAIVKLGLPCISRCYGDPGQVLTVEERERIPDEIEPWDE